MEVFIKRKVDYIRKLSDNRLKLVNTVIFTLVKIFTGGSKQSIIHVTLT
jgi:hypothetical protein